MLRVVLFYAMLACSLPSLCQNLVANGGFQDRNVCTEFKATCAPEAWFFLPSYILMAPGDTVNHYETLLFGNLLKDPGKRNFIYTKLLCPLKDGQSYKLSLWVTIPHNNFEHLDVWFGMKEPQQRNLKQIMDDSVFNILPDAIDSTRGAWRRVSFTFTALGYERFMMLGNFSTAPLDRSQWMFSNNHGDILCNIDDVSLYAEGTTAGGCPEYNAIAQQAYDQNLRHPPRLIDDIPLDSSLIAQPVARIEPLQMVEPIAPPQSNEVNDTLIIPDVLFAFNSSRLNNAFSALADSILKEINKTAYSSLEIIGHTDNAGSAAYNNRLSLKRAKAIQQLLVSKGIAPTKMSAQGAGSSKPIASNETAAGRKKNRRVEIIVKH
jgi:outer membrane protein OmpA-like peptidoglycan-associated protein